MNGRRTRIAACLGALIAAGSLACSCAPSQHVAAAGGRIPVVAAENFWGSIAAQLGGDRVSLTSVIDNPNTDPHDYEPTVADARAVADARLVVVNGAGYDPWADRLLAADAEPAKVVLDVGRLAGVPAGGNPHLWYSPADVRAVIAAITSDYVTIDPSHAAYFEERRHAFETVSLAKYDSLVAGIRATYAGTPIGASESIVAPLASGLGLTVLTPERFLSAISEGSDPSAADKALADSQIRSGKVAVFVYNAQNVTPDVTALVAEARARGIPVVTVTETMVPADGTFQDWQTAQLEAIQAALHTATGR